MSQGAGSVAHRLGRFLALKSVHFGCLKLTTTFQLIGCRMGINFSVQKLPQNFADLASVSGVAVLILLCSTVEVSTILAGGNVHTEQRSK